MKINFKYIITFVVVIVSFIIIPIEVNAANGFSIVKEVSSYNKDIPNQDRIHIGSCAITKNTALNDYMHDCVREVYPIEKNYSYTSEDVGDGRVKFTSYFSGRVDVWGVNNYYNNYGKMYMEWINNNGGHWNWTDYKGKNVKLYPGMKFVFTRYETLASFVGQAMVETMIYSYKTGQLNLKVEEIEKLPNDVNGTYLPVSVHPNNFKIENYGLEEIGGVWYVKFDVRIEKLRAGWDSINHGTLVGAPGITSAHAELTRGYHYFLPIKLELEYLSNRCFGNKIYAEQYAKENPNTCCWLFPETCCNSLQYAQENPGISKICCERYPETCCNISITTIDQQLWLGVENDDGIWEKHYKNSYHANTCCSDPTFYNNNPGKCVGSKPFNKTPPASCPPSSSSTRFYTASYITLDTSNKLYANGKNIACDYETGNCTSPFTYTYTINVGDKKNFKLDTVGYSYFDNNGDYSDYKNYLKQKQNKNETVIMVDQASSGIPLPTSNLSTYSLSDDNFSYKVSNIRMDEKTKKYLIDIEVTIHNLQKRGNNIPIPYENGGYKMFFVPIKIDLCWNSTIKTNGGRSNKSCTNMEYAKEHLNECCNNDKSFGKNNYLICCNDKVDETGKIVYNNDTFYNKNKDICKNGKEKNKGFTVNTSLTCNSASKSGKEILNNTEELSDTEHVDITKEELSIEASSVGVASGTGFEYPMKITDKVEYSLNLSAGYSIDTALENKDKIDDMYNDFNNTISNIKNKFPVYTSTQQIFFDDDRTNKDYQTVLDYSSVSASNIEYSGETEYYYKDSSITCDEYEKLIDSYWTPNGWKRITETVRNWRQNGLVYSGSPEQGECDSTKVGQVAIFKDKIYNTTATQSYTYTTKLPYAYINKNNIKDIKYKSTETSPGSNYILGGNKIYTNITDSTGTYHFKIEIKNGGISKKINNSNLYSCHYTIQNCIMDGTCPDDPEPNCDPLTDPSCPTPPTPGTPNYYFRPISLTNPFPNERKIGPNWANYQNGNSFTYITNNKNGSEKGENIYTKTPMYEITITNQMAQDIRKFNKEHKNYSSDETMVIVDNGGTSLCNGLCRESLFLSRLARTYTGSELGLNKISVGDGLKIDNSFRRYKRNGAIETLYGGDN